jgi:hypothetical protein
LALSAPHFPAMQWLPEAQSVSSVHVVAQAPALQA